MFIFLSLFMCLVLYAFSNDELSLKRSDGKKLLTEGNKRYQQKVKNFSHKIYKNQKQLASMQAPFATVLTCSDSRVSPELIFDQALGDLFVIRVAGNICDQNVLASIEFSVAQLETPTLLILGHQNCVAVQSSFHLDTKKFSSNMVALLSHIQPIAERIKEEHPNANLEQLFSLAIKENIRESYRKILQQSSVVRERHASGKLNILLGVFQIETGEIEWLKVE